MLGDPLENSLQTKPDAGARLFDSTIYSTKQIELILKFGVIFELVAVRSMARSSRGIIGLLLWLIRKLSAPQL